MTKSYIPPPGLYFRLLAADAPRVMFSRTWQTPYVDTHPANDPYDDQFFELIPSVKNPGSDTLYLVKSKATKMFLYSRYRRYPLVGHDNEGDIALNRFKVQFGTGKHASHFRLVNYQSKTVFGITSNGNLEMWDHTAYPDKGYFSFLFEDVDIVDVRFHERSAQPVLTPPLVRIMEAKDTKVASSETYTKILKTTNTRTFEYTDGFTIAAGATFNVNLPLVNGGVKIDKSRTTSLKWGESIVEEEDDTYSIRVDIPAGTKCMRTIITISYTAFDVPFTVTLRSRSTHQTTMSDGILRGTREFKLSHTNQIC